MWKESLANILLVYWTIHLYKSGTTSTKSHQIGLFGSFTVCQDIRTVPENVQQRLLIWHDSLIKKYLFHNEMKSKWTILCLIGNKLVLINVKILAAKSVNLTWFILLLNPISLKTYVFNTDVFQQLVKTVSSFGCFILLMYIIGKITLKPQATVNSNKTLFLGFSVKLPFMPWE